MKLEKLDLVKRTQCDTIYGWALAHLHISLEDINKETSPFIDSVVQLYTGDFCISIGYTKGYNTETEIIEFHGEQRITHYEPIIEDTVFLVTWDNLSSYSNDFRDFLIEEIKLED